MVKCGGSINPKKYHDEMFELLSIPAYDQGQAEIVLGKEIGSSKKCVQPNDVLLSKIVPHIKRCWVVPESGEYRQIASGEWIVFRGERVFPQYLRYILMSDRFHQQFMSTVKGVGGSLLRADPVRVSKIKIPLPSLGQQEQIADILDLSDHLRQRDQALIDHYIRLTQSLFLETFGDPVSNPHGFERVTIAELVSEINHGTRAKSEQGGEYPYLRMNNITYQGYMDYQHLKYINLSEKDKAKYLVKKGDILFNRTNSKELVGKTGIFSEDVPMAIAGYLIRIRLNASATPYYVWSYLNSRHGKSVLQNICKKIVGSANINTQELQKIKLLLPPIELQNQFAENVQAIEKQKRHAEENLKKSNDLFNALLQKAFAGELIKD